MELKTKSMNKRKVKTVGLDPEKLTDHEIRIRLEPDLEILIKCKDGDTLLALAAKCTGELRRRGFEPITEIMP